MTPYATGAVLMIASGSVHAVVNAIVKGGKDKAAGRAITDATGAAILLPAIAFVPWPDGAWGYLLASAVLHAFYLYALVRAYAIGDLSAVYPVLRGTAPLITASVSIGLLGERATIGQIIGIAVIGAAMFVMVSGKHIGRAALGWSLLTGCFIASYTIIDALGVRAAPSPASYIVWVFVQMGFVVVLLFGLTTRGEIFRSARAVEAGRDRGGPVDSYLWLRALCVVARPDRAARRASRDRYGDCAHHRDLRAKGARDMGTSSWRAGDFERRGVDSGRVICATSSTLPANPRAPAG